jgi:pyruvate/2-oxoglutarate dehydrogenase complex dihydrolipoamide acyltransferase (E2) component
MTDVTVPQWGLTMDEAVVDRWLKAVGDRVEAGESLADLETDKVTADLESPASGVLAEILVAEGETVTQGQVIARIDEG